MPWMKPAFRVRVSKVFGIFFTRMALVPPTALMGLLLVLLVTFSNVFTSRLSMMYNAVVVAHGYSSSGSCCSSQQLQSSNVRKLTAEATPRGLQAYCTLSRDVPRATRSPAAALALFEAHNL